MPQAYSRLWLGFSVAWTASFAGLCVQIYPQYGMSLVPPDAISALIDLAAWAMPIAMGYGVMRGLRQLHSHAA